jgi:hypothetical protein
MSYLHKLGIKVFTAPYSAAPQLVYMEKNNMSDGCAGSAALLAFGANLVITSIDFEHKTARWIDSKVCQGKLMLTPDSFTDLLLLSGNVPALLPPLAELEAEPQKIQAATRLLSGARGDVHAVVVQQQKDEEYWNAYRKARYATRHPLQMTKDGRVEIKSVDIPNAPRDVHEVYGRRLPDELTQYL